MKLSDRKVSTPRNVALIQFTSVPELFTEIEKFLRGMCIRWRTDDEIDHSLETRADSRAKKRLRTGDGFVVEPFDSILGVVNMGHSNLGFHQVTKGLQWSHQKSDGNRIRTTVLNV